MQPRYQITVRINPTDLTGNVYYVIAVVNAALREVGATETECQTFTDEASVAGYGKLYEVARSWIDLQLDDTEDNTEHDTEHDTEAVGGISICVALEIREKIERLVSREFETGRVPKQLAGEFDNLVEAIALQVAEILFSQMTFAATVFSRNPEAIAAMLRTRADLLLERDAELLRNLLTKDDVAAYNLLKASGLLDLDGGPPA